MQRDQKVGLALGVLLIGTVAAFFFRNETHPSRRAPNLERAAAVDREIAEKRLTPYLSPTEPEVVPQGIASRFSSRTESPDMRTGERRLPRWEELQAEIHDPFAETIAQTTVPAPAPDPIQMESLITETASTVASPTMEDAAEASVAATAAETIHEVQRGETLSSIAGKYLGSQARFQEIYEQNRHQLRDANDLQIGMKLRIPEATLKVAGRDLSPPLPVKTPASENLNRRPQRDKPLSEMPQPQPRTISAESPTPIDIEESPMKPTEPSNQPPSETPKLKFTPAKRRPARAANAAP